ncbi:MAG: LicD family protein [Eubacteriales bacterium]|nr:LicD family protein [Eubacteriales bacterium]
MKLDEIHKIELDILLDFDRLAKKNGLRYYLSCGTLLGAVRHKGFIPWDDDIDLMMPRPDYEKLIRLEAEQDPQARYQLVSWKNGRSAYPFLKMVDSYTTIKEKYMREDALQSVWIDIFPLDGMPDDDKKIRRTIRRINFYRNLLLLAASDPNKGTTPLMRLIKRILVPICRKMNIGRICDKIDALASAVPFEKAKWIGDYVWNEGMKEKMPKTILQAEDILFEDRYFPAPANRDEYLTRYFGDYMQLPPEDQRIPHDFEVSWNRKVNEGSN